MFAIHIINNIYNFTCMSLMIMPYRRYRQYWGGKIYWKLIVQIWNQWYKI